MAGEFSTVVYSVIAAVIVVPLTAYINIKIKYATNEKDATKHLKNIILNIVLILSNAFIVYLLFKEVQSPEPVTRKSIFNIAVLISIILFFIITYFIRILLDVLLTLTASQLRHLGATHKIIDIIGIDNGDRSRGVEARLKSTDN